MEQTELTSKTETDSQIESRRAALGGGWGVAGWSKTEEGLSDTDNTVETAGRGGERWNRYKGDKWKWKKCNKKLK